MREFTSFLANGKNKREPLNDLSRVFLRLEGLRLAAFLPVSPIVTTIVLTKMTAKALLGAILSQF